MCFMLSFTNIEWHAAQSTGPLYKWLHMLSDCVVRNKEAAVPRFYLALGGYISYR